MRPKFVSAVTTGLVVFAGLVVGSGPAAASSPATARPGSFSCTPATAANNVPTPPPIWEHPGGEAPTAAQVASAAETIPLCPAGEVPSQIQTSGVAAPPGEPSVATTHNVSSGPSATPPEYGGVGCRKGGCYWYVNNQVAKPSIGMEYETNVSEPRVSSFAFAHSIDQLAVGAGTESNQYTIELGWDVDPGFGWESGSPEKPHLFIFVNPDKYLEGGESCYDCHFIASAEPKYSPGETLEPSATKLKLGVKYLSVCFPGATGGCWWIWVGTQWIGYVPSSAWGGHFTKGTTETDYGEVFDSEKTPTSQMGDGQYGASAGATSMTQILALLSEGETETTGYHATQTNGALYSPGDLNAGKTEWHFGGPGVDPAPLVQTEGYSLLPAKRVTLMGSADPNNLETHYYFEYGQTEAYGSVSPTESAGSGVELVPVNTTISGLKGGTTYHYRLVAYNVDGYSYGVDRAFIAPPPIFGYGTIGSKTDMGTLENFKRANTVKVSEYGTVKSLSLYAVRGRGYATGKTQKVKAVIYRANGAGEPTELVATGKEVVYSGSEGWLELPFGSHVTVGPEYGGGPPATYWIGFISGDDSEVMGFKWDEVSKARVKNENDYTSGPSNPFGTHETDNEQMSLYATYTPAPTTVTKPASEVARTTATLNATVNPNGKEVKRCSFKYGTTKKYGHAISCETLPGAGNEPVAVSAKVKGLLAGTTYYYYITAGNEVGYQENTEYEGLLNRSESFETLK
jgi:hypothetical protein